MMAALRVFGPAVGLLVLLAGCADPEMGNLDRDLAAIRNDPGQVPRVELPEIPEYEAVPYDEADRRSPFMPRQRDDEVAPVDPDSERAPDPDRPRGLLERYELSELELVGTLTVAGQPSALVRVPDGQVHRLSVGNHMGGDHGRIVSITESSVVLVETVLERNAWVERSTRLSLDD